MVCELSQLCDVQSPAENGDVAGNADASVAFPAGWNRAKPWFVGAKAVGEGQEAVSPAQAPHVKPVMPPPPFLSQPWQGSRLGPLPPVGPLAQGPMKAREVRPWTPRSGLTAVVLSSSLH